MKPRLLLLACALAFATSAMAQPVVTNFTTSVYAVVTDPLDLSFGADGTLYVGRDASGSGGGSADAVKIHRVAPGGAPVTEFGNAAIPDPDALIVDLVGLVSGTPGSVLVGGVTTGSSGRVSKIAPDGTVTDLFGTSTDYYNPSGFAFDAQARLFFTTFGNGRVYRADGGTPAHIITLSQANSLAVDALGRLAVNAYYATSLPLYTLDGALLNTNFATVLAGTPIARAPGGVWGTNLLVVGTSGQLLRLNADGTTVPLGSGFSTISDFRFGPDGALYASEFDTDRIYRFAKPAVPGAQTTIYARVADPIKLSFAPDGTLFVGRDNAGSGGNNWDAVRIHRIAPGGSPVTEYGNDAITDPDAVFFDAAGLISGVLGAVIIGGETGPGGVQGRLSRILSDGTVTTLFGPSSTMINPSDFVGDSSGRLLFTDYEGGKVWVMTNGTPIVLVSGLTQPVPIAVDSQDRILVNATTESQVRLYSATGMLLTNSFVLAATRTPLALGSGGFWGTGVYYVNTNGDLMTVDLIGQATKVGVGFGGLEDMTFGPDGALYASHFDSDLVWRIAPGIPLLSVVRTTTNTVAVSWPSPSTDWTLQQNTNSFSSVNWSNVTSGLQDDGTNKFIIINPPTGNRFYRLKQTQ